MQGACRIPQVHANITQPVHACMAKVQTIISPRRKRSDLFASARSAADDDASGYSPPTP